MINKNKIWFLTLFSLILVLSVYYVTMPSELLNLSDKKEKTTPVVADTSIAESDILVALRIESEKQLEEDIDDLKMILTDINSSIEQKNKAFDNLKDINLIRSKEEELENIILKEYKLKSFIKITNNQIRVVVASSEHDAKTANSIMRAIQKEFDKKMSISIKFQK